MKPANKSTKVAIIRITEEFADQVREAFGQDSQIVIDYPSAAALVEDYREFLADRKGEGNVPKWLTNLFTAEQLKAEQAAQSGPAGLRESRVKANHERLNGVRGRVKKLTLPSENAPETPDPVPPVQTPAEASGQTESTAPTQAKPEANKRGGRKKAETSAAPVAATAPATPAPKHDSAAPADHKDPRFSGHKYYALLDRQEHVVGRGWLAYVDGGKRRIWFAPRTEEQTDLWKTSKWAQREVDVAVFERLTVETLKSQGWPSFGSIIAAATPAATTPIAEPAPAEETQPAEQQTSDEAAA
ncbi:MAG TPA: hypothetical protein VI756_10460 [Blastocatellia bacterium]